MRAFLCSIDDTVWDTVKTGWTRLEAAKSTWDKAPLTVANANSKALNAIFCGYDLVLIVYALVELIIEVSH